MSKNERPTQDAGIDLGSIVRAFPIVPAQSKWIDRVGVVVEVVPAHKTPRTPHMRGGPSNHSKVRFVIPRRRGTADHTSGRTD